MIGNYLSITLNGGVRSRRRARLNGILSVLDRSESPPRIGDHRKEFSEEQLQLTCRIHIDSSLLSNDEMQPE